MHSKLFIHNALKWQPLLLSFYLSRSTSLARYDSIVIFVFFKFSIFIRIFTIVLLLLFSEEEKLIEIINLIYFHVRHHHPLISLFNKTKSKWKAGKMVEDYWGPSLKMLSDFKFLENLKTFDKDNIPPPLIKKIRDRYILDIFLFCFFLFAIPFCFVCIFMKWK